MWLLINLCRYDDIDKMYPSFDNKHWAQVTLAEHASDKREFVYTLEQVGGPPTMSS